MSELEKRIRQLEIENIGLKFQVSLLLEKQGVTIEEMKEYAQKSLDEFPESEQDTDIVLYLNGLIQGGEAQKP